MTKPIKQNSITVVAVADKNQDNANNTESSKSVPAPTATANIKPFATSERTFQRGSTLRPSFKLTKPKSNRNVEFKVGDHAVYPGHGVGRVVGVEAKEILGARAEFYIVQILETGMKVMIPKNNVSSVGLRPIITKDEAGAVLGLLRQTDVRADTQTWIVGTENTWRK